MKKHNFLRVSFEVHFLDQTQIYFIIGVVIASDMISKNLEFQSDRRIQGGFKGFHGTPLLKDLEHHLISC